MEQELPTLPVHSDFSDVRVVRSLRLCVMFLYCCLSFWLLWLSVLLAVVLSDLRFTASDYPFGILDLRLLITPLVS